MRIQFDMMRTEQGMLGPGKRVILWTHGCPRSCPGCIAAETNRSAPGFSLSSQTIAERILEEPDAEGVTISGGEPFAQAEALSEMLEAVRSGRKEQGLAPLGVILFTGYRIEEIPSLPGGNDLLSRCDAVIDGEYRKEQDAGEGWRGSTNQRLILRTSRYSEADFLRLTRTDRVSVEKGEGVLVGLPTGSTVKLWNELKGQKKQ